MLTEILPGDQQELNTFCPLAVVAAVGEPLVVVQILLELEQPQRLDRQKVRVQEDHLTVLAALRIGLILKETRQHFCPVPGVLAAKQLT
jgi:hypothetical protein